MKTVNLASIVKIYRKNSNKKLSSSYMKFLETDIKVSDLQSLTKLLSTLKNIDKSFSLKDLNGFYMGYKIPQIGKEFDLLRLNDSSILNIEYKASNTGKVHKQLLQNKYYLKFLGLKIYSFSYIQDEDKLYVLNDNEELVETDFIELINVLKNQCKTGLYYTSDLNLKFKPSNYLISPFSKTKEFLANEYFLTQRQEELENIITQDINNKIQCIVISGEAGSGKTLLTYHLAKNYINKGNSVGLLHCGKLNKGHLKLIEDYNWNIKAIKNWKLMFDNSNPNLLIIDEFQRINEKQFEKIVNDFVKPNNITLLLSGDGKQIFQSNEGGIFNFFEVNDFKNVKKYRLNTKIRTNEKLINFIKIMFSLDNKKNLQISNENIDIVYFDTIEEANYYIETKEDDYKYISYTPSHFYDNKYADLAIRNQKKIGNAHEVIGQEFENVIVVLGEQFYYDGNKLKARKLEGIPYATLRMFYQQITRAINKLEIVVVNNLEVFNKLIDIFN